MLCLWNVLEHWKETVNETAHQDSIISDECHTVVPINAVLKRKIHVTALLK